MPQYRELGFRSQVAGTLKMNVDELVDRRLRRFMGDGAAFAYLAMKEAIADAGLGDSRHIERTHRRRRRLRRTDHRRDRAGGLITKEKGPKQVGPFMVPRAMSSTVSANLATAYKIKGLSYSISSACSTSAHCIGNAVECIQLGKADRMFAGGGEELDWTLSVLFDAMGAMSSKYNDTPERASRAYDKDRDGFVISGGGGILVLEDLEVAKRARRQDLRRDHRLRRHLRRRRHGGAVRRRRRPLHEARHGRLPGRGAAQRRRSTTSTPTALPRRWATSPSSTPSAPPSATTSCRPSARPSR